MEPSLSLDVVVVKVSTRFRRGKKRSHKDVSSLAPISRVAQGQAKLESCLVARPDLAGYVVSETIGDGLCFLHAVLQQLRMNPDHVWKLAMAVLRYMHDHIEEWQAFANGDDLLAERMDVLKGYNLARYLEAAYPTYYFGNVQAAVEEKFEAYALLLDRLQGVRLRDWGSPRLYCDELFIQQFLNMIGGKVLFVENTDRYGSPLTERCCTPPPGEPVFEFRMVHYNDVPEHFNAIMDAQERDVVMRDQMKLRLERQVHGLGTSYWWPRVDVYAIAEEILPRDPATVAASDSDAVSVASSDGELPEAQVASQSAAEPGHVPRATPAESNDAELSGEQVASQFAAVAGPVPRAMPAEASPHPRARQEERFLRLALQWHEWVVVPCQHIGQPMSREILDAGVFLPPKHCFWSGCVWTGETNIDLWKHIVEAHGSEDLEAAMNFYDPRLKAQQRLHTVLNQVASVITRRGPPLCSAAQDRRSLYNLYKALEPEDSVQALICFSCGCSHPAVKALAGSRIRYYPCYAAHGRFLGLKEEEVEDCFRNSHLSAAIWRARFPRLLHVAQHLSVQRGARGLGRVCAFGSEAQSLQTLVGVRAGQTL